MNLQYMRQLWIQLEKKLSYYIFDTKDINMQSNVIYCLGIVHKNTFICSKSTKKEHIIFKIKIILGKKGKKIRSRKSIQRALNRSIIFCLLSQVVSKQGVHYVFYTFKNTSNVFINKNNLSCMLIATACLRDPSRSKDHSCELNCSMYLELENYANKLVQIPEKTGYLVLLPQKWALDCNFLGDRSHQNGLSSHLAGPHEG